MAALAALESPLEIHILASRHLLDSDPRDLNSMEVDVVGCLNRVAMVAANTRVVVDTRAVEVLRHSIQVASINRESTRVEEVHSHSIQVASITLVSTRAVVVHAPEEGGCRSHTMDVVLDRVLLLVLQDQLDKAFRQDQFPSCTKPHMSNIKPRW